MGALRLLIVEDHALLTQTLRVALGAEGFEIEAPPDLDPASVRASAEALRPTVVLLDLDLGLDVSGVSLIGPLRETGAEVVVMTGTADGAQLGACIEAGAAGIFRKSQPFEQLVDAIRVAAGHGPVTLSTARQELLRELREHRSAESTRMAPFERLTPRESEVLRLLTEGRSAEKIAAELVVSLSTIRSQIRAVLMKLGVNSQLEAVALARRSGWFST